MKHVFNLMALLTLVSCGSNRSGCKKSTREAAQKYNHLKCSQESYDSYCSRDVSKNQLDYSSFYSPNCYSVYNSCLGLSNSTRRRY